MAHTSKIQIAASHTRTIAFLIDLVVCFVFARVSFLPFFYPNNWDLISFKDILVINFWYYAVFFVFYMAKDCIKGQSFGKWFMNIQVVYVQEGLKTPGFIKSWVRNIFLIAWPIEILFFLFSKFHRRIGDKYIGTVVIKQDKKFVIRSLTNRLLAVLLISACIWTLSVLSSPQLVKKSSFYQTVLGLDSKALGVVINEKDIGYFKELYVENKITSLILPLKPGNNGINQIKIFFDQTEYNKNQQISRVDIIKDK